MGKFLDYLVESKSQLLNAFEKKFGHTELYGRKFGFEPTPVNVQTVFQILDDEFFDSRLGKIEDVSLFIGNQQELDPIIRRYARNDSASVAGYQAIYVPEISISKNEAGNAVIKRIRDGIFMNITPGGKFTLPGITVMLAHEMIHCLDMNEGTLRVKTEDLINKGAPPEVIDYTSHFTPMFVNKRKEMKDKHGLTIIVFGDGRDTSDICLSATDEIRIFDDVIDESGIEMHVVSDEFKKKYEGFFVFPDEGCGSACMVFGQKYG